MTMLSDLEGTGESFSVSQLMDVRSRTRKAVGLIADQVEVGMVEEDAKAMARDTLSGLGHAPGLAPHHRPLRSEHHQGLHGAIRTGGGPRIRRHLLRGHRSHLRRM